MQSKEKLTAIVTHNKKAHSEHANKVVPERESNN
jgi:hypothetical protein